MPPPGPHAALHGRAAAKAASASCVFAARPETTAYLHIMYPVRFIPCVQWMTIGASGSASLHQRKSSHHHTVSITSFSQILHTLHLVRRTAR